MARLKKGTAQSFKPANLARIFSTWVGTILCTMHDARTFNSPCFKATWYLLFLSFNKFGYNDIINILAAERCFSVSVFTLGI